MILGMLVFFAVVCFGVLTHDKSRFENKVYKHIPLYDWMLITIFPIGCYIATALFTRSIILREFVPVLPIGDFELLIVGVLVAIYGISGNSIHFVSKVLWRYLDPHKHKKAYEVNEIFHGKFSHLLTFVCILLVMLCLSLLEINHPLPKDIDFLRQLSVLAAGIFTGLFATRVILNSKSDNLSWRINRSVFFVAMILNVCQILIVFSYQLNLLLYPFNAYTIIVIATFILASIIKKALFYLK